MTDVLTEVAEETGSEPTEVRPFQMPKASDAQLADLRSRIKATRWPEKETVTDASQGVQLATMQKLANYWATEHDWRKVEARLSALPQFITTIDGLDIHFIHVRSKHDNALPVIVTHVDVSRMFSDAMGARHGNRAASASHLECCTVIDADTIAKDS